MKSTKQTIDEAVKKTLDPLERRKSIELLERRLPLSRSILMLYGLLAIVMAIGSLFWGDSHNNTPGIFVGIMALLFASYGIAAQRLVQLKVEEEKSKCEQSPAGDVLKAAPEE